MPTSGRPDPRPAADLLYSHDRAGNLATISDPTGMGNNHDTVAHTWSVTSTPLSLTYPGGSVFRYQHDAADRVKLTTVDTQAGPVPIGSYTYRPDGRVLTEWAETVNPFTTPGAAYRLWYYGASRMSGEWRRA